MRIKLWPALCVVCGKVLDLKDSYERMETGLKLSPLCKQCFIEDKVPEPEPTEGQTPA